MANSHGGARDGAGRRSGVVSEAKKELSALAKDHAQAALATLVQIATSGDSESARVSAANAILDRGYGKPMQQTDLTNSDGSMAPKPTVIELVAPKMNDANNSG